MANIFYGIPSKSLLFLQNWYWCPSFISEVSNMSLFSFSLSNLNKFFQLCYLFNLSFDLFIVSIIFLVYMYYLFLLQSLLLSFCLLWVYFDLIFLVYLSIKLLIWGFVLFFKIWAFTSNFPLSNVLPAPHKFDVMCFYFHLHQGIF